MSKSTILLLVAILTVLSISVIEAVPASATATWSIQTIANDTSVFSYCPIVVDSADRPHIAYDAMYSSWNGSVWNTQQVAGGTIYALALDADNNPHVLFDEGIKGLIYARWNGLNWTTLTIDKSGTYFNRFGVLALDSAGNPHVAYTDSDKAVKYAIWNGLNWNIQIVDTSQSDYAPRVSMAVDADNTVYLLYGSSADVKLAVYKDSNWTIQTVASDMDSLGNLVLDSKGYPHFIYRVSHGFNNNSLMYACWNGISWNTQDVATNVSEGGVGTRGGFFTMGYLALDSYNNPHIAFVTAYPEDSEVPDWGVLAYASWTGKTWDIQTVNSTVIAQSCYLALDSNGNPHISLIGVTQGSEAAHLTGPYSYKSPIMYATTVISPITEPTETPVSIISVIVLVIVVTTCAGLLVYFKKRGRGQSA